MKSVAPVRRRAYRMRARAAAAEATGERIVAAALRRFSTRPYDEVSLEDVARDAGVSVSTVIRRFGSKEDLFVAADRAACERIVAQRGEAPAGDVAGAVRNLLHHYEEWGGQRLLMLAQEHRVPAIRRHTEQGRAFHRAWVERVFAPLLESRRPADRETRVLALVAATDVYVWKLLRQDLRLSTTATQRVIETLIAAAREGER